MPARICVCVCVLREISIVGKNKTNNWYKSWSILLTSSKKTKQKRIAEQKHIQSNKKKKKKQPNTHIHLYVSLESSHFCSKQILAKKKIAKVGAGTAQENKCMCGSKMKRVDDIKW